MTIADKTFTGPWDIFPQAATGQELGHAANLWDLFTREVTFNAASGANVITVPDNIASGVELVDAGGIEYMRVDTQNAQPQVHWNIGGADIDYRWEAVGVDPALLIRGSDGYIGIGALPNRLLEMWASEPSLRISDSRSIVWTAGDRISGIEFYTNDASGAGPDVLSEIEIRAAANAISPAGAIVFRVRNTTAGAFVDALYIDPLLGGIGIATTDPKAGFDLHNGSYVLTDSDVTQPVTVKAPASGYGYLTIQHGTQGGLRLAGLTDASNLPLLLEGVFGVTNPTDTMAAITIAGYKSDGGTDVADLAAAETVFQIKNNATILVTVLGSGNMGIGIAAAILAKAHVDQASATAAIPVLYLDQADISEEMIEFNTTIGVGNAIEAVGGKILTVTHFIKCTIPGPLTRYIPCGTIA